jgi:hypothetical protein
MKSPTINFSPTLILSAYDDEEEAAKNFHLCWHFLNEIFIAHYQNEPKAAVAVVVRVSRERARQKRKIEKFLSQFSIQCVVEL